LDTNPASPFEKPQSAPLRTSPAERAHAIIGLQTFEGTWKWSTELFELLDTDEEQVTKYAEEKLLEGQHLVPHSVMGTVLATLLAMGFLRNKNADLKSTWELVYGKAEDWVDQKLGEMELGQIVKVAREDIMALA
jgi:hypothetical protein